MVLTAESKLRYPSQRVFFAGTGTEFARERSRPDQYATLASGSPFRSDIVNCLGRSRLDLDYGLRCERAASQGAAAPRNRKREICAVAQAWRLPRHPHEYSIVKACRLLLGRKSQSASLKYYNGTDTKRLFLSYFSNIAQVA
jgi:hypothetical protein